MLVLKQVLTHYMNGLQEKKGLGISLSERREAFNLRNKGIVYGSKADL